MNQSVNKEPKSKEGGTREDCRNSAGAYRLLNQFLEVKIAEVR